MHCFVLACVQYIKDFKAGDIFLSTVLKTLRLYIRITIEKAQLYSNALISSDVSWYRDTFSIPVPCIVPSLVCDNCFLCVYYV